MALLPLVSLNPSKLHPSPLSFSPHRLPLPRRVLEIPSFSRPRHSPILRAMEPSNTNNAETSRPESKRMSSEVGSVKSPASAKLPLPNIPVWARWVLGSVVLLALPFYKRILRIEDVVEKTVDTVAEVVEKAAEVTAKVASDIAAALPDGTAKDAALEVEQIAEEIDKDAEFAEAFIDKVEKIEEEVDELVGPIGDGAERTEKEDQAKKENLAQNADRPKSNPPPSEKK